MRSDVLEKHFRSIGARVKIIPFQKRSRRVRSVQRSFRIDIKTNRHGEYFEIVLGGDGADLEVMQVVPEERHLLLYSRNGRRFLCGHDERHWFVAAIADRVSTVRDARKSLIPRPLRDKAGKMKPREISKRRNSEFKRQGEWFFVPTQKQFDNAAILKNEPLQRTPRSKPHICQELVRIGGTKVYVVGALTYTEEEYQRLRRQGRIRGSVSTRVANPEIYVRGYVRHPDHATIWLDTWHRVYLNGELVGPSTHIGYLD